MRTARQVSHRNVCRVFDIGETQGLYYITMEYIDGDDLSMLLRRIGHLPSDKAIEISRQNLSGLRYTTRFGSRKEPELERRDIHPDTEKPDLRSFEYWSP